MNTLPFDRCGEAEFVLVQGRIIDPPSGRDHPGWVHVRSGRVVAVGTSDDSIPDVPRCDVSGLIVCPGLVDIHVHLREPGGEHKETIATGLAAAAAGGFTTVCCMPNTSPALDHPAVIESVRRRALEAGDCRLGIIAAATIDRAGREVVDVEALQALGVVAFSDDGDGIEDERICRLVSQRIAAQKSVLFPHCEFKELSRCGIMHLGEISRQLGFVGYDPRAEEAMIERDIAIAAETGVRLHIAHISSAAGIDLVRQARKRDVAVTTEVCPHHLLLTDRDVVAADGTPDPNSKMSPPLRSADDRAACRSGLRDGAIACVVTDHAPHAENEKSAGFADAPMGIVGLETSLGCVAAAMAEEREIDWPMIVERMSSAPARVLGLAGGTLKPGVAADITLVDPKRRWRVDPSRFRSKSRNTPFGGMELPARAVATLVNGICTFQLADSGLELAMTGGSPPA